MEQTEYFCDGCGSALYSDGDPVNGAEWIHVKMVCYPFGEIRKKTFHLCHDEIPEEFHPQRKDAEFFWDVEDREVVAAKVTESTRYGGQAEYVERSEFISSVEKFAVTVDELMSDVDTDWSRTVSF